MPSFSAVDFTLNIVSECRAPNRSSKIFHGSPGKVLDFCQIFDPVCE